MRKQILTALGVLILGSSVAFASPQQDRSNFNDQRASQTQQRQYRNGRSGQNGQYGRYGRTPAQPVRWQTGRQNDNRRIQLQKKYHRSARRDPRANHKQWR
jgi:hypothetical protein